MIADQMITYRILIIFLELVSLGTATWALSARAFVGPPGREKGLEGGLRRLWVDRRSLARAYNGGWSGRSAEESPGAEGAKVSVKLRTLQN